MIGKFSEILKKGVDLSESEAFSCLETIFSGDVKEGDIVEFLELMCQKGEASSEIIGFSKCLLKHRQSVELNDDAIDLCGTGGSGRTRFNVSTTVAFVLAAGGYKVAKHGNRGSRTNNGSFDLLEKLGINISTNPEEEAKLFEKFGLCFFFARSHHPAMKAVGPARMKLGKRSIFNLIGPLCNPADVPYQIVGVSKPELGPLLANSLSQLGKKRILVVYGEPGIDEFSVSGSSKYWINEGSTLQEHTFNPQECGIAIKDYDALPGGNCDENSLIFQQIIDGQDCNGLLDMVAINAGAAIYTYGKTKSIAEGTSLAKDLILSGKVRSFFDSYPKD